MNKIVQFLLLIFLIFSSWQAEGAGAYPGVKESDQQIARRLQGVWTGKRLGFRGTLVYQPNGECSSDLVPEDVLTKLIAGPYSFTGSWEIQNGYLWSTVKQTSTHAIKVGSRYRNEILLLTADTFITKNERGWTLKFSRVR